MKKAYSKPLIAVESFQLNAAIAASCSKDGKLAINYASNTCTDVEESGPGYFGEACAAIGLDNVLKPGGEWDDQFCYHGSIGDLFLQS